MKAPQALIVAAAVLSLAPGPSPSSADSATPVFSPSDEAPGVLLSSPLADGEAVLWHLYHSGFALRTSRHFLIFDYWPGSRDADPSGGLSAGFIDPAEIAGQNVVVFISHEHDDHWYRDAIEWRAQLEHVRYVVSPEVSRADERYRVGAVTTIGPDRGRTLDDIEVETLLSTDSGVAFLVDADGLCLYHSGDHASWNWSHDRDAETRFVTERLRPLDGEYIDIAMAVCDPRLASSGWGGFFAFADRYTPALIVPMHLRGDYEALDEVARLFEERGAVSQLWKVEGRGDCRVFRAPHTDR